MRLDKEGSDELDEQSEERGKERSDEWKIVSYCALVVYGRRFAPPVLHSAYVTLAEGWSEATAALTHQ